ncbi:hypothetical protein PENTCL1PPCAC_9644, partial [Pristionchus entomophagus]
LSYTLSSNILCLITGLLFMIPATTWRASTHIAVEVRGRIRIVLEHIAEKCDSGGLVLLTVSFHTVGSAAENGGESIVFALGDCVWRSHSAR